MGRLIVYNFITANGYFKGPGEDISWAKQNSAQEREFAAENFKHGNILVFGRVTYQMMASYWPSADALKNAPQVAEGMNKAEKIVFSKTLDKAEWNNTRVIKEDIGSAIKKLKKDSDKDMTILGSGTIVNQLTELKLIDEYQVMVYPVMIGGGTTLLKDISYKLELNVAKTRTFESGSVVYFYQSV
jgi:dihydrofolate reductase